MFSGILYSQMKKNPMSRNERIRGVMTRAVPHPTDDPEVTAKTNKMREIVTVATPTKSRPFDCLIAFCSAVGTPTGWDGMRMTQKIATGIATIAVK